MKRVLLATGMLYAFNLFLYVNISDKINGSLSEGLFYIFTFVGGALLTSVIYNDMHHPLERYQYLTLPCSALERFTSKFIITCPMYLLYALLVIMGFKLLAPAIFGLSGSTGAPILPFDDIPFRYLLILFLTGQVLFLIGATVFRNYAVLKTGFSLFVLPYTFFLVTMVALKVIYFDHYDRFWTLKTNTEIYPGIEFQLLRHEYFIMTIWGVFYLWLIYIAYTCLKDHEA
jgi:hypothetical protein